MQNIAQKLIIFDLFGQFTGKYYPISNQFFTKM